MKRFLYFWMVSTSKTLTLSGLFKLRLQKKKLLSNIVSKSFNTINGSSPLFVEMRKISLSLKSSGRGWKNRLEVDIVEFDWELSLYRMANPRDQIAPASRDIWAGGFKLFAWISFHHQKPHKRRLGFPTMPSGPSRGVELYRPFLLMCRVSGQPLNEPFKLKEAL